jgi:hypothetical protein
MGTIFTTILLLVVLSAAMLFVVIGALFGRLVVSTIHAGPGLGEEAFERGDSLKAWWQSSQTPEALDGPRDNERLAFAARRDPALGDVMVEERAATSSFHR